MPRASWKGFLPLSLVSCPVYLSPATTRTKSIPGILVRVGCRAAVIWIGGTRQDTAPLRLPPLLGHAHRARRCADRHGGEDGAGLPIAVRSGLLASASLYCLP